MQFDELDTKMATSYQPLSLAKNIAPENIGSPGVKAATALEQSKGLLSAATSQLMTHHDEVIDDSFIVITSRPDYSTGKPRYSFSH